MRSTLFEPSAETEIADISVLGINLSAMRLTPDERQALCVTACGHDFSSSLSCSLS